MPYNSRDPNAGGDTAAWEFPHARSLAGLVVLAVIVLFLLRHFYGSISVGAGTK